MHLTLLKILVTLSKFLWIFIYSVTQLELMMDEVLWSGFTVQAIRTLSDKLFASNSK
jgi:hypothetical protein